MGSLRANPSRHLVEVADQVIEITNTPKVGGRARGADTGPGKRERGKAALPKATGAGASMEA